MKKQHVKIEKTTKQIVKHIADQEVYGWPPLCPALCYQPIRPKKETTARPSCELHADKM